MSETDWLMKPQCYHVPINMVEKIQMRPTIHGSSSKTVLKLLASASAAGCLLVPRRLDVAKKQSSTWLDALDVRSWEESNESYSWPLHICEGKESSVGVYTNCCWAISAKLRRILLFVSSQKHKFVVKVWSGEQTYKGAVFSQEVIIKKL